MNQEGIKARYLSEPQNRRFAGLITIYFGRRPYSFILDDLLKEGYAVDNPDKLNLTEKGLKEMHRLAFFCGLLISGDDIEPIRLSYVEPS